MLIASGILVEVTFDDLWRRLAGAPYTVLT